MDQFAFAEFAGGPFALGQGHGRTFAGLVRAQVEETLAFAAAQAGLGKDRALAWALEQLPRIEALGPHWGEELRGLAEGAGISLAEAVALQVRPGTGRMAGGCTSLGACGDATGDGQPLGGQNRDLLPGYGRRMFVLLLRPEGRMPLLMHSVPGELGGPGINGHGLCLFANSLWAKSGRNWMAPPLFRRALLECASADEAVERARTMDGPAVGNYLLVDRAGRIRNLEVLPEGVAVIARDRGVYAHANNCQHPELRRHELDPLPMPGSERRRVSLQSGLEAAAGSLTVEAVKRLLAGHGCTPESVCRHAGHPQDYETAAALLAEPATCTLHISYGTPCVGRFTTYTMAGRGRPTAL
jgi:hypothetical protein